MVSPVGATAVRRDGHRVDPTLTEPVPLGDEGDLVCVTRQILAKLGREDPDLLARLEGKNPEEPVDAWGNTLLHVAAFRGILPLVSALLVEFHASVNPQNHEGLTPLSVAWRGTGDYEVVQLLQKHGGTVLS